MKIYSDNRDDFCNFRHDSYESIYDKRIKKAFPMPIKYEILFDRLSLSISRSIKNEI